MRQCARRQLVVDTVVAARDVGVNNQSGLPRRPIELYQYLRDENLKQSRDPVVSANRVYIVDIPNTNTKANVIDEWV